MQGIKSLSEIGASITVVSHLHSKNLIIDNDCITFGSFNWLSASTSGDYCNYETTTIICNEQAGKAISKVMCQLKELEVCSQNEIPAYSLEVSDQEIDYAIELYREQYNKINYRKLSENIIFKYFMNNIPDLDVSFGMLWKIASIQESSELINSLLQSILSQCVTASNFVELAEILVKVNKHEQAREIARRILRTDRMEEYDNFEGLYGRLELIGLAEIGNQFEIYVRGS